MPTLIKKMCIADNFHIRQASALKCMENSSQVLQKLPEIELTCRGHYVWRSYLVWWKSKTEATKHLTELRAAEIAGQYTWSSTRAICTGSASTEALSSQ